MGPTADQPRFAGFGRIEDGRWLLSFGGYAPLHHPPGDDAGFLAFATSTLPPEVAEVVRAAEPLGPVSAFRYPAALRRHYDRMARFPSGFVIVGDALTSFNPVYGQGMTVAALQAERLRAALLESPSGPDLDTSRFMKAATRCAGTAWAMGTVADRAIPSVPRAGGLAGRIADRAIAAAVDRVDAAAEDDPAVASAFLRVHGLIDPPHRMCSPGMLRRVYGPRSTSARPEKSPSPARGRGWSTLAESATRSAAAESRHGPLAGRSAGSGGCARTRGCPRR